MKLHKLICIFLLGLLIKPGITFAYSNNPSWESILPPIRNVVDNTEFSKEQLQSWRNQRDEDFVKLSKTAPTIINDGIIVLESAKINNGIPE